MSVYFCNEISVFNNMNSEVNNIKKSKIVHKLVC